jgi:hypothetical protein
MAHFHQLPIDKEIQILKHTSKLAVALTILLLTGFVQPASAATLELTIPQRASGEVNNLLDGTTKEKASILPVPFENKVLASNTVRFALNDLAVGQEVEIVATNASLVTKLHTQSAPVAAADGATSLKLKSIGGNPVSFYAFTTSSSHGSINLTYSGSTSTYHLIGRAGPPYNLILSSPSVTDTNGAALISASVQDVFGNALNESSQFNAAEGLELIVIGATASDFSYSSTSKNYQASLMPKSGQTNITFSLAIDAIAITGLEEPKSAFSKSILIRDIEPTIAALEAQVAQLKEAEKLARKAHNQLARKWNKAGGKSVKLLQKPIPVS